MSPIADLADMSSIDDMVQTLHDMRDFIRAEFDRVALAHNNFTEDALP